MRRCGVLRAGRRKRSRESSKPLPFPCDAPPRRHLYCPARVKSTATWVSSSTWFPFSTYPFEFPLFYGVKRSPVKKGRRTADYVEVLYASILGDNYPQNYAALDLGSLGFCGINRGHSGENQSLCDALGNADAAGGFH